jgi:hypothetical protein
MGNSQSSSGTQFTGNGELPVVQSVEPCHLSGDPDLYGLGIRVGFYLQYLAAIIAIVSKADEDFVGWRVAFVPVAAATFLGLCINSTGDTLVIMDWAIMLQLVLWFPAFFALPIFKGIRIFETKKQELLSHIADAKQLEPIRKAGLSQYGEKYVRAHIAVVNAEDIIMNDTHSQNRLAVSRLVNTVKKEAVKYVNAMKEQQAESVDHAGELSQAITQLGTPPNDLQTIRVQVGELDLQLRQHHVAALRQVGVTEQDAQQAVGVLGEIAQEEREIQHNIKKLRSVLKRIHGLGLVDTVSAGISLIIYSAYCFLTPWLFFVGIDRGARTGCDVKVLFLLAPVSVYNHSFGIFLKFVAIVSTIVGLGFALFGIIFLIIGVFKEFERKAVRDNLGLGGETAGTQTSPNSDLQNHPTQPDLTMTGALVLQDQTQVAHAHAHPHWLSTHLEAAQHIYHNFVHSSKAPSMNEINKEIDFHPSRWGFGLSFVLLETIVVVEMTIYVNHLQMGPLLSSTGQLIALLVGAFMLLLILFKCLVKLYWHRNPQNDEKNDEPNNFERVSGAVLKWLHRLLRTHHAETRKETQDTEKLVGLEQGGQGDGQTGSQTGTAQISGRVLGEVE